MAELHDFCDIQSYFARKIDDGLLPNASMIIIGRDGEKLHCHLGWHDMEKHQPIGEKPLFRLASMTKPITGVAVMMTVEQGLVDLDAPIEEYIPVFKSPRVAVLDENSNVIGLEAPCSKPTVRQLLSHCSGLGHQPVSGPYYPTVFGTEPRSLAEMMPFIAQIPLAFQPGTKANYNGVLGFNVLAHLVEVVTRTPFEDFIHQNIFLPLHMNETTFFPSEEQWQRTVVPYDFNCGKLTRHDLGALNGTTSCPYSCVGGWAGLVGSLEDYANFASMLLCEGTFCGQQLLKPETIREMRTPQLKRYPLEEASVLDWGLSMRVVTRSDDRLPLGCYGWSGAYKTHFWIDPAHNLAALYGTCLCDGESPVKIDPHFEFESAVAEVINHLNGRV